MTTRVVNIRLSEPYDQYIGGPGQGEDGYFGNFAAPLLYAGRLTREQCLEIYRAYLKFRLKTDPEFNRRVLELRGKTLACFCAPLGGLTFLDRPHRCHGQVLAEWLDADSLIEGTTAAP